MRRQENLTSLQPGFLLINVKPYLQSLETVGEKMETVRSNMTNGQFDPLIRP